MIGKMLSNRYEILEEIGRGGMGIVYKAKCHLLNRIVAIKVLRPEFSHDEEFIRRFRSESQSAASLSHPNIVSIYDVGNDGDIYYIVMEFVNGKTLKQTIKESGGPLTINKVLSITSQVLRALDNAHKHNIIHRDIKPHNILIAEDGTAKVTDFGIAKAATDYTMTYNKNIVGTAQYFSPEQAKGSMVDAKSDIYSLGIVMYEMLTGKVPFEGDSPISVALKHIEENLNPPSKLNPNIPKGIDEIVLKATEKDSSRRYSDAGEMLSDINKFVRDPDNFMIEKIEEDAPTRIIPAIDYDESQKTGEYPKPTENTNAKKHSKVLPILLTTIIALVVMGGIAMATLYFINHQSVAEIEVPNVVGYDVDDAEDILKEKGLTIDVGGEDFSDKPEGEVLTQDPAAPVKVKKNSKVKVRVSKGQELIRVPDVVNYRENDAVAAINDAGLEANIIEAYDDNIKKNHVISQSPAADEEVKLGSQVKLYVSKGSKDDEKITMIDVVGKTLDEAKQLLGNKGLRVRVTEQERDGAENIVLSQNVTAGQKLNKNATVYLTVSKKPEAPPVTKNITVNLPDVSGEMNVLVRKKDSSGSTTIYSGVNTYEDSPINITNVPVKGHGVIEVYINDVSKPYTVFEIE